MAEKKTQSNSQHPISRSKKAEQCSDFTELPEENILQIFGTALRHARNRIGITQEQLAGLTDIDRSHISDLERGKNSASLLVIYKLSCALEISLCDLLQDVDDEHSKLIGKPTSCWCKCHPR